MKSTVGENILEHSANVAMLAHSLAVINNIVYGGDIDPDKVCAIALYHETSEVITGDLPTPIKYYNPEINLAYKAIEHTANDKLLSMLPDSFKAFYTPYVEPDSSSYEHKLVKAADKLSAYIKCVEELRCGNSEFVKAEKSILSELEASDVVELKYFMDNFLDGYKLTLDELE